MGPREACTTELANYGWNEGRWVHFRCAKWKDKFANELDFPHAEAFRASEESTTCCPCVQSAADAFAARDIIAERIVAHETVGKLILADLPHGLCFDGSICLVAAALTN